MHWTVCLDLEVERQKKPVVWRLEADEDWSGLNIHTAVGTCGTLELMELWNLWMITSVENILYFI